MAKRQPAKTSRRSADTCSHCGASDHLAANCHAIRKPSHKETRRRGHPVPGGVPTLDEILKMLEDMKVKYDEAIQNISDASDRLTARVAVLESASGVLTPTQEAAASAIVTKLDGTALTPANLPTP